jgi:hypothetical protein
MNEAGSKSLNLDRQFYISILINRPGLPDGLFSNPKYQFGKKNSGPQIRKCRYILWPFGIFYGYLGYFVNIRFILCLFDTFYPALVSRTKKNLATL